MQNIILYRSDQLRKAKVTGGVRRFMELLNNLGKYCNLTLMSGDESIDVPASVKHISMHHIQTATKESTYIKWNYKYLKEVRRSNYDWIIVFDVPPAIWLALSGMPNMCLMLRKDLIGYEKVLAKGKNRTGVKGSVYFQLLHVAELLTLLRAKLVIVQCEWDKQQLINRHRLFIKTIDRKTHVQINNVNPSWARKADKSTVSNIEAGTTFKIVTVNNFSDLRKGVDIFLDAAVLLIEKGYNMEFHVAGNGKYFDEYKEKYKKYSSIMFDGYIADSVHYISNMDLSVVPSRADSCPNTVLEALYNEVPVIGAESGGIPEILKDKGALFKPDAQNLMEKIKELYLNRPILEEIRTTQKERKKALEFNWPLSIIKIVENQV